MKRLHMRRIGAQAAGKDLDESITRLKPGRKPQAALMDSAPRSRESSQEHEFWELGIEGKGATLKTNACVRREGTLGIREAR